MIAGKSKMYTLRLYFLARYWRWFAGFGAAWLSAGAQVASVGATWANQGDEALHAALREERLWLKVHAAEALVLEGRGDVVRGWLAREPATGEGASPRIGRWRLQVRLAVSTAEREAALAHIEAVFLDPAGPPDALQAVESLCKLRAVSSPTAAAGARKLAQSGVVRDRVFAQWFLALAGVDGAADQIVMALDSNDDVARLRAAYALRWLGESRPAALAKLAVAADREPAGSAARPYLVGSAYRLRANPARMSSWRGLLSELVAKGEPSARYDVAQVLMDETAPAELARWQPLLTETGDTRIAAGWVFLHVGNRQSRRTAP